jgi:hypothetical protein
MHPIDCLFSKLPSVEPYPAGVCAVDGHIAGTSFFPGGDGLWKEEMASVRPSTPVGKIMVLGHNFDSKEGFQKSVERGSESLKAPTWRNLLNLLEVAQIQPHSCFFTNVYMGLIAKGSNIGRFPGAKGPEFVSRCLEFLKEQIAVLRPAIILTLGAYVPPLVAEVTENFPAWKSIHSLRALDRAGVPKVDAVTFKGVRALKTTVVALTHPAQRHLNVGNRAYRAYSGHEAELLMLNEALNINAEP